MIILFLASGLFLGWSLGANDASNIFGSAVGSRMISFRKAAIVASVFVIIGAVVQGSGTSSTLGRLGAVNALGGSFTVALSAAITVYLMTKFSIPVSTTQAIVGAIIGWNIFTNNPTDSRTLVQIISTWVTSPALGAIFAVLLYIIIIKIKRKIKIHLVSFESYIRAGLFIAGAFGAYSLGANNIANVMGVFVTSFNLQELNLGLFSLSSAQQLFLLGSFAIAAGILTFSSRVMEVIGCNIVELSSEAAFVVIIAQSLVLFIFSSSGLSALFIKAGIPAIPMVPISSTQIVIGSVIGIGLYRGVRNINFRILGDIATGWIATPVFAGILTFFSLFFVKNIFGIETGREYVNNNGYTDVQKMTAAESAYISDIFKYFLLALFVAGLFAILIFYFLERKKRIEFQKSEERFWRKIK